MDERQPGGEPVMDSGGAGTVVVLDYTGRRVEAPVSSLGLETCGYTVWNLLEPPYPQEATADSYAAQLMSRYGPFPGDLRAMLAYCMAAPIAQELLALMFAKTGFRVPLVTFDGEPATARAVEEQYVLAARSLGELLELDEADRMPPVAFDEILLRDEPTEAVRRMCEGLLELGARAVAAGAEDADATLADAQAFGRFYLDWLSHLVAAHNTTRPAWGGPVIQIVSADHTPNPVWPGATSCETVRVAATRNDLLRHPDVVSIVLSILRKRQEDEDGA